MERGNDHMALDRIERALSRIEAATARARSAAASNTARHDGLRQAVERSLGDLDALMAAHRHSGPEQ